MPFSPHHPLIHSSQSNISSHSQIALHEPPYFQMSGTLALSSSAANPLSLTSLPKMPLPRRHQFKVSVRAFTDTRPRTASSSSASLYEVLRVKHNASQTEIKSAYRSLAKLYHPDALPSESDGRDFIEIHNAYATLSDPAARALYDLSLNVHLHHRQRSSVGFRSNGFYPTRRWETDQCW